ncbi:Pleckstrin y domain-containing F member 2 [Thoreauomyces humboldtii]|nr:Pleckstrin y domain-containing F member 2 [Thoreauomyces humboldtii]
MEDPAPTPKDYDVLYDEAVSHRRDHKRGKLPISHPVPQHDILHEKRASALIGGGGGRGRAPEMYRTIGRNSVLVPPPSQPPPPSRADRAQTPVGAGQKKMDAFAGRFGSVGLALNRPAQSHALRNPGSKKSRPSLAAAFRMDAGDQKLGSSPALAVAADPPPPAPVESRAATRSFENAHALAEAEFFFLGRPLSDDKEDRVFLREDAVFKVTGDTFGMRRHARQIILLADMLIYGTPISRASTDDLTDAYGRQTVMLLDKMEVFPVNGRDEALVDIETPTQALQVAFETRALRDEWIAVVRSAIRTRRSIVATPRRRSSAGSRSSQPRPSSLTEWGLSKLWQGFEMGVAAGKSKRSTVLPRHGSVSSISSLESLPAGWIPDHEATTCMICQETKFSVITRKHHCRQCGRVICWKCSRMDASVRLCTDCHDEVSPVA